MRNKLLIITILAMLTPSLAHAQNILSDFKPTCDSLSTLLQEHTSVKVKLRLKSVLKNKSKLDFYFSESLGDVPWKQDDIAWFKKKLKSLYPDDYSSYSVGDVYTKGIKLQELITPALHNDGDPVKSAYRTSDPKGKSTPIVERVGGLDYDKGMSGRHLAVWQSHGMYYAEKLDKWTWQRSKNFMTVEDMYTQSYVLPFLIPMLENAGAYVMTPRERDTQTNEVICDNDPAFKGTGEKVRTIGKYSESGDWSDAGKGFADKKMVYTGNDNPFTMGTVRKASCDGSKAKATWTPTIPEKGQYAVYVSYKTLAESSDCAHYTVKHLGGETEFSVNQRIGGGTWIYLGTFEFDKGANGCVVLDNEAPEGKTLRKNAVVTADGVKFGGGYGKVARGKKNKAYSSWTTSGVPSYMEGALYWMQWAGVDSTITRAFKDDYTNDYADRGAWTQMMAGGSRVNPKEEGKGIPFDLSFAFHTDAGLTPNDSTIGTLGIYTLMCKDSRKLPNGEDRMICREYTDYVQTQVVNDIRAKFNPDWTRRQIWDRNYSESRTSGVPGMILELLAHQNFADMKFGMDPTFRFTVARSVYKGMLKFLSNRYGAEYQVQPLPVSSFSAVLKGASTVQLSWSETKDDLEETASPKGFILYTRVDDKGFDDGKVIKFDKKGSKYYANAEIKAGHIYSFKIEAFNDGGKSFPSEILSVGVPKNPSGESVLIVNNFYRLSPPAWFDNPVYAGFDTRIDGGVPYIKDITYIGDMYQFRRAEEYQNNDASGFGASFSDEAGKQNAGNTFDYPYIHGKALLESGYPFSSMGSDAFAANPSAASKFWAMDMICGKQVTTITGCGNMPSRFQVFPEEIQEAIKEYTSGGGNLLISGANIGTDVWDGIWDVDHSDKAGQKTQKFVTDVLGYKWQSNYASRTAKVSPAKSKLMDVSPISEKFSFYRIPNSTMYCVETPDGIVASSSKGATFLRYSDTNISAGVCFDAGTYRTVCIGFPIETIKEEKDRKNIIITALNFFEK